MSMFWLLGCRGLQHLGVILETRGNRKIRDIIVMVYKIYRVGLIVFYSRETWSFLIQRQHQISVVVIEHMSSGQGLAM